MAPGSVLGIQIRIHKVAEYGSNLDPDPQHCLCPSTCLSFPFQKPLLSMILPLFFLLSSPPTFRVVFVPDCPTYILVLSVTTISIVFEFIALTLLIMTSLYWTCFSGCISLSSLYIPLSPVPSFPLPSLYLNHSSHFLSYFPLPSIAYVPLLLHTHSFPGGGGECCQKGEKLNPPPPSPLPLPFLQQWTLSGGKIPPGISPTTTTHLRISNSLNIWGQAERNPRGRFS